MQDRVRIITAESPEEEAVIGHLRGWCHNGTVCAICRTEIRALEARIALESVISG